MNKLVTTIAAIMLTASSFAQAPSKMSYQAVVRNSSSTLVTSSPIGMQISILQGSSTGTPVYVETQSTTTNSNGLATLEIGNGTPVSGTFSMIDWSAGPYFIKTETDPDGGTNYTITGTSQLMSVPYALYAKTAGNSVPGPIGPPGAPGAQGPKGDTGVAGPQGLKGDTGVTGPQGAQGLKGDTGAVGPQGPIGLTGAQGIKGDTGATGLQGPVGLTGAQGLKGDTSAVGPQGPIGLTGAQGLKGDTGAVGPQGSIGLTGAQGIKGDTGATGLQGPIGLTGAQGIKGDTGVAGPQGIKGDTGATGAQGSIGLTGAQGLKGDTGAIGPQGPAGQDGLTTSVNYVQEISGNITLAKSDIGLGNVDNTSDLNKPISTATQTALDLKSDIDSPTFTGTPLAPTATTGDNSTQIATTAFVNTAISNASTAGATPDATTSATGKIQLAGDLGGTNSTAAAPVITDGAITTSKLADGSVTGAKIASGTVTGSNIASQTITAGNIASNTITGTNISLGAIQGANIDNATVTGTNLASSIALTGTPTAPTATTGDTTTQLATDAFVSTAVSTAVTTLNNSITSSATPDATTSATGKIQLAGDLGGTGSTAAAPVITDSAITSNKIATSIALAGTPTAPTGTMGDNSTQIATDEFVADAIAGVNADLLTYIFASATPDATTSATGKVQLAGDLAGTGSTAAAPVITDSAITSNKIATSVALAGTPTAPTATSGDTTTQIATDAFVAAAVNGAVTTLNNSITSSSTPDATTSATGKIQLAGDLGGTGSTAAVPVITDSAITSNKIATSIALAGTPTAPTGTMGDNSTQIATDEFVADAIAGVNADLFTYIIASSTPDATTSATGKIQLAGDLGGTNSTAAAPVITDAAISTSKLADAAVTTAKLADNAVTNTQLADSAVSTSKIEDGAVNTAKIADSAITSSKLDTSIALAGVPTAPTAAQGDVSTQIATDEFVNNAVKTLPLVDEIVLSSYAVFVPLNNANGEIMHISPASMPNSIIGIPFAPLNGFNCVIVNDNADSVTLNVNNGKMIYNGSMFNANTFSIPPGGTCKVYVTNPGNDFSGSSTTTFVSGDAVPPGGGVQNTPGSLAVQEINSTVPNMGTTYPYHSIQGQVMYVTAFDSSSQINIGTNVETIAAGKTFDCTVINATANNITLSAADCQMTYHGVLYGGAGSSVILMPGGTCKVHALYDHNQDSIYTFMSGDIMPRGLSPHVKTVYDDFTDTANTIYQNMSGSVISATGDGGVSPIFLDGGITEGFTCDITNAYTNGNDGNVLSIAVPNTNGLIVGQSLAGGFNISPGGTCHVNVIKSGGSLYFLLSGDVATVGYNAPQFITGKVDYDGSILAPGPYTVYSPMDGQYNISFTVPFPGTPTMTCTPEQPGIVSVTWSDSTHATVITASIDGNGDYFFAPIPFDFIVVSH
jgi:hypothetical protein